MPTFHYCLTAEHEDPFPPVAELPTIEADDPFAALEKLRQRRILAKAGVESAWIRVAVEYYPDGAVKRAISQQVPLVPLLKEN